MTSLNYNSNNDVERRMMPINTLDYKQGKIDLHTHSNASDGTLSPGELIKYAYTHGLSGISLTDHDSVSGLDEALEASGKLKNFYFIPGVELSAEYRGIEIHLIGYAIDWKNNDFLNKLNVIHNARFERLNKMIEKLLKLGIELHQNHLYKLQTLPNPGRLHVAKVLKDMKVVGSTDDAFRLYLNKNAPAYSPRYKLTPGEAIELIINAGGLPVLAHPGLMNRDDIISVLLQYPLAGIEVYYPSHSNSEIQRYLSLANKNDLLVTGGSDFHAPPDDDIRDNRIGECSMTKESVAKLIEYSNERLERRLI